MHIHKKCPEHTERERMGERRRHGENITTANGLFEGFEKV
jgi:hypothetical protein